MTEQTTSDRNRLVGARFARAVASYDRHADVQRAAARQLAISIAALPLPPRPRILEIGCGTGFLTRELAARLGCADWTISDIAAPMVAAVQNGPALPGTSRYLVADGEYFVSPPGDRYDLICSSLAVQWFEDLESGLGRLASLLAPGGYLAIATLARDTFAEWRDAHEQLGLSAACPLYPHSNAIGATLARSLRGGVHSEHIHARYADGLDFLRGLKHIGASAPAAGSRSLPGTVLKQVLARFNEQGASVTYQLAYGTWRKPPAQDLAAPRGVFVTGTDTGVGKTLVSAVLAQAWHADYWKPYQTGLSVEQGDTETVTELAALAPHRVHPPLCALQAPLAPWAAAPLENIVLDASEAMLPAASAPLIVEGAGGLYVPIDDRTMMIDLIARLGLPVVLVARSGLGTINHTLLSVAALRERGIAVLGVVMNGPPSPGNRQAIERFGQVDVLLEIGPIEPVDAQAVARLARDLPSLASCLTAAALPD